MRKNKKVITLFTLVVLILSSRAYSLDVDLQELESQNLQEIDYINFTGEHEFFNTADEIKSIGKMLARAVERQADTAGYMQRYGAARVLPPADSDSPGADIIIFGSSARVDHINNLRRIIAGYLQEGFEYDEVKSNQLAEAITIYNTILRGNESYFYGRYIPEVRSWIDSGNAGLSRNYTEWAGSSRIVIPVTTSRRLAAVSGGRISEPAAGAASSSGTAAGTTGTAAGTTGTAASGGTAPVSTGTAPGPAGGTAPVSTGTASGPTGGTEASGTSVSGTTAETTSQPDDLQVSVSEKEIEEKIEEHRKEELAKASEKEEKRNPSMTIPILLILLLLTLIAIVFILKKLKNTDNTESTGLLTDKDRKLLATAKFPVVMRIILHGYLLKRKVICDLPPGSVKTIGGKGSSFYIQEVNLPPDIAEIENNGKNYIFRPVRKKYFIDTDKIEEELLGREIDILLPDEKQKRGKLSINFNLYHSPLENINKVMRSVPQHEQKKG